MALATSWECPQISAATAEQQPVVWGEAEVVGHELVVDHAAVARQQRTGQVGVQRRGSYLVGANGQQAPRQTTIEAVDVGVAGQHQHLGAYFAVVGTGDKAVASLVVTEHLALLVDAPASSLEGAGQALRQFQRVEVCTFGVVQRGLVARAVDPLRQLVTADQAQGVVAPLVFGLVQGFFKYFHSARHDSSPQAAQPVVDIEAVALGQFAHFVGGPAHAGPQPLGTFDAQGFFQRRHVARPTQQRLAPLRPEAAQATRLASSNVTRLPA